MRISLLFALATAVLGQRQHRFDHHNPGLIYDDNEPPSRLYTGQRLVKTSEGASARWVNSDDISGLRRAGVGFIDITDAQELYEGTPATAQFDSALPGNLTHGSQVTSAISRLNTQLYGEFLDTFTAFHNRYYDSQNGRKSSEWLQSQVEAIVDAARANVTVRAFSHRFPQSSVIARIEGTHTPEQTVVISAHQDSVNMWIPWFGRAPGADDDGSGTVTILEALRVVLAQGIAPKHSVEFHWYAGEEGGLLGSQDVALKYKKDRRAVVANMHFDMTGYWESGSDELIGLVADRTDSETRELVKKLCGAYTRLATREFDCGYGCSDHASWSAAGYRSAMAFESDQLDANKFIHSPKDTVDTLDFDHMLEFSKLAVAFAYEVGDAK